MIIITSHILFLDGFTWIQRIKVALGFARLHEFLHDWNPPCLPYLVRNIDAAHIMLDQVGSFVFYLFSWHANFNNISSLNCLIPISQYVELL